MAVSAPLMMGIGATATVAGTYMSYKGAKKAGKQQQQANEYLSLIHI